MPDGDVGPNLSETGLNAETHSNKSYPVKTVDQAGEKAFIDKVQPKLQDFKQQHGDIVFFDVDGTMISQDPDQQGKPYVRTGFDHSYRQARELGLKIGVLTLRSGEEGEIEDVSKQEGYKFDELLG